MRHFEQLSNKGRGPGAGDQRIGRRHALPASHAAVAGHVARASFASESVVSAESAQDRDEEVLAELATQLADEMQRGQLPNVDAVIREHPRLAEELRGLWATMLVADCVAAGASSSSNRDEQQPSGLVTHDHPSGWNHRGAPLTPGDALGDYELEEELAEAAWAWSTRHGKAAWDAPWR